MNYQYHHVGIPITEPRPGERYSPVMDMYTSEGELPGRIQYHRFGPNCPLHPLIQTQPHIAYKVICIDEAIQGKHVLLEPYFPLKNFRVAIIEEYGAVIEFIETSLSEDEIWNESKHQDSMLYPQS
ncbi:MULTISPECIES: helicase [Legionella]|uniref:helicase n=1 Tax=Legionella TaxID=445 RepID=UPI0009615750|nr:MULTISPECIES: helicase [Legionella]MBN9228252.1 helicase [Legionella steelei]OJW09499.1 MAG: helicase [Legionella sp. 39-23]